MTGRPSSSLTVLFLVLLFLATFNPPAYAQTETGTIYGSVSDPTGAVVPSATVRLIDVDRGIKTEVATGNGGFYSFGNIRPGQYRMEVEKTGFKLLQLARITVNVQDNLEQNFKLALGAVSEAVTVTANAENLNTADATVSTLIDNRFVENMPLNGRSFSSLLDLTPGVVLIPSNFQEQGQFSVNGQRPDANYFTVDGVAANLGTSGSNLGQGGAGLLPVTSAFGGMSNLVSLDALQEFRVQTSTFSPEFGRMPGAQVSVVTKSGTNDFHGTAFEYFRNDVLDANDWFADDLDLKKAALRQNDFGGVLGGPILKDKLFFLGSYEGLRVRQPRVANSSVPTAATILSAPAVVQPLLEAFPKPNGAPCPNCQPGTAGFSATYSDPSSLDSYSARVDYPLSRRVTIFGRFSDAPSSGSLRSGPTATQFAYNMVQRTDYRTQTVTAGSNQTLFSRLTNEFRFNFSRSRSHTFVFLDNFGGGVPPPSSILFPLGNSLTNSAFLFYADSHPYGLRYFDGDLGTNVMHQINVTDAVSHIIGTHQLKFGMDYRRIRPEESTVSYELAYEFLSLANVLANKVPITAIVSRTPSTLIFSNWSLFAQDTWKAMPKLTLSYGLRWEYNAAPSSPNGTLPMTVNQVNDLATTTLAPLGTALWHAQKDNFAPRLGLAWQPFSQVVIRVGAGIFYDLGYSQIANGLSAFPYAQQENIANASFPLSSSAAAPPPFSTNPPVPFLVVADPNHVTPRTYEWNAAMEQSLSNADVFTLTYVGAGGRKLMRHDLYFRPNPSFTGEFDVLSSHATSNYNALQAEYRHRASHGLQTLVSYTWAHAIDDVSSDGNYQNVPPGAEPVSLDRGPSDYDIRHTFSAAVSYDIPRPGSGVLKPILGSWSTDSIIYARSAPPVNVVTGSNPFPGTLLFGANSVQRPDVVPGVPFYLHLSSAPGGKVLNVAAFSTPVPATAQGDLGRNALRGFGATQWDITLRRQFRFTERFSLQFRGDFFNILNHPNFGNPINYLNASATTPFGYATQMLNNYLGAGGQSGGLNPLFQIGGPRSIQLALKLQF